MFLIGTATNYSPGVILSKQLSAWRSGSHWPEWAIFRASPLALDALLLASGRTFLPLTLQCAHEIAFLHKRYCLSNKLWDINSVRQPLQISKLDVDPRRNDDASQMSSYRFMLRPTWTISALWHKSKYNLKFNFNFLGFHAVVPVKTFSLMYQLLM